MRVEPFAGDPNEIAELHLQAFPGFFLTQLGKPFLTSYYRCVETYPGGILLVARKDEGAVVGFAAGFDDPPAFYAFLRSRFVQFILPVAGALLRRPKLLRRAIFDLRYVKARGEGKSPADHAVCELASIGVLEPGSGVGSMLIDEFLVRSWDLGSRSVILTTDRDRNDAANRFYDQKGFTLVREFVHVPGRVMNEYRMELKGAE